MADEKKDAEQLQARIAELEAELDKQRGIVTNAEKKFSEWAAERGEERKSVAEVAKALKDAVTDLRETEKKAREISDELAEAKRKLAEAEASKQGPAGGGEERKTASVEEQIEAIQSTLTDDETAILDAALEAATPEEQASIREGGAGYLKFLQAFVRNARKPEAALPPWRKKPTQEKVKKVGASDLDRLFNQAKKSVAHYPDGPSGGTPRGRRQVVERKPVAGNSQAAKAAFGIESE